MLPQSGVDQFKFLVTVKVLRVVSPSKILIHYLQLPIVSLTARP